MRKNFHILGKKSIFLFIVICISLLFAVSANACRMWGMVSDMPQAGILGQQLTAFRAFGSSNQNGWAIGYFFNGITQYPLTWPIVRRGGPPANTDPDYQFAMTEVTQQGTKVILAHVRIATSGHSGVSDPHPFTEPGWMFCHNGSINSNTLIQLIGTTYLDQHKPDYTNPYIDSELFFIYLMKTIREGTNILPADSVAMSNGGVSPYEPIYVSIEEAIKKAVSTLDSALNNGGHASQLTFLLTNGKKLWGCRYADVSPDYYTLYYSWPLPGNNWAVCSEPITGDQWTPITMYHVMTFEPGMRLVDTEIPHI